MVSKISFMNSTFIYSPDDTDIQSADNNGSNNQLSNLLLNLSTDLIFCVDTDNCFTNINKTFCEVFQLKAETLIGTSYYNAGLPAAFIAEWKNIIAAVIDTKSKISSHAECVIHDGNLWSFSLHFYPLLKEGNIVNGIAVIASYTIREKAAKAEPLRNEFYEIIDNTPDLIGIHSEGKVVFINKYGVEILKAQSRNEILGKPFLDFVPADYKDIVLNRADEVVHHNYTSPMEEKFVCLDGTTLDVEVKAIPIQFNGKDSVLIIARDISEKKKAQQELNAEKTLLRTIIDSVPESVYVKDAKGGKVIANTQDLMYMGIGTEKEAIGKTDEEVYAKYNSAYFNKDDQYVIQDGKPIINKLDYFVDANNQQHWLLTSKVPVKNHNDEIIGLIGIGRDVSERQKILEQLFETQERLNKIILSSSDWVWEVDTNGVFTYCSDNIEKIAGWKPEEIIGKSILNFMHSEYKDQSLLKQIISNKDKITDLENWIEHKNGSEICLLTNGFPSFDKTGNFKGYIGVIKNITDWKNKENRINELNEHLSTLIEAMPDVVFFKDHEGRWLITNNAAKKLFNLGETEWIGKTDLELAEAQPAYTTIYEICKRTDDATWESGTINISYESGKDLAGTEHHFHVTKIPIFDSDGKRKGLVIIGRNITKDRLEEQRLKLLETVISHASDAITIVEIDHQDIKQSKIIYVNNASCEMAGISREEFLGKPPRILFNKKLDDSMLERIKSSVTEGTPLKMEMQDTKGNDEVFWSLFSITPVSNSEGNYTHWIGIKKDITEAKVHEQEIKKAIIKGQENEKYFISGELHDNIAQILVGAKLALSLVAGKTEKEIERLKQTNEYLDMSINEIRYLSHSLAPSAYYQKNLISSIEQLLKNINKENTYEVSFEYDQIDYSEISGELQLNLYRILQEQLQNIVKHSEATVINVQLRYNSNKHIHLIIADNGKGFDTNLTSKGIGLQNIKNRAETFSGDYIIKSAEGKGCELIVTIPVQ